MLRMWYFSVPRGQSRDEKAGLKLSCERSEPERGRRGRTENCGAILTGDRVLYRPQ